MYIGKQRPAYQVKPYPRTIEETVAVPIKEKVVNSEGVEKTFVRFRFEKRRREVNGYMVYFPRGHSIYVESRAELIRMGFAAQPDIVDMKTGYRQSPQQMLDLAAVGQAIVDGGEPPVVDEDLDGVQLAQEILADESASEKLE